MKNISVLIFICLFLTTTAQERLTDILSETINQRHILSHYEGKSYILTTDLQDSLKVYRIDEDKGTYLYSRHFPNINNEHNFDHHEKYLLTSGINGSYIYDFVQNTIILIPYTNNFLNSRWKGSSSQYSILSQYSSNYSEVHHYLVELETGNKTFLSESIFFWGVDFYNNKIHIQDKDTTTNEEKHFLYDINTKNVDLVISHELNGNYLISGNDFLYIADNQLYAYNIITKNTTTINKVKSFHNAKIFNTSDEYIYTCTNNYYTYIHRFNKSSFFASVDSLVGNLNIPHSEVLNNKIVFGDFSDMTIYDLTSQVKYNYKSSGRRIKNYAFLDDKYIIHPVYTELKLIDLSDMSESVLMTDIYTNANFDNIQSIKLDNKYLVNFDNRSSVPFKLLEVDIITKKAKRSTIIPIINGGLYQGSNIFKVGNDLILSNRSDLYFVEGSKITQLNNHPIFSTGSISYKIHHDRLSWVEIDGNNVGVYSFSNGIKKHHNTFSAETNSAPFKLSFIDYLVTNRATFIKNIGFSSDIIRIDHATGEVKKLGSPNNSIFLSQFNYINEYVYYELSNGLKVEFPDGTVKNVPLSFVGNPFTNTYNYNNKLYTFARDGFYELIKDSTKLIFAFENLGLINSLYEKEGHAVIQANGQIYVFDGYHMDLLPPYLNGFTLLSQDLMALITTTNDNQNTTKLYHLKTKQIFELPAAIAVMSIKKIFKNFNTLYLVASDGSVQNSQVRIYRISSDFVEFSEVFDFESSGWNAPVGFTSYNNEGILFVGKDIFLMNDTLGFENIQSIAADNPEAIEKNGYFYYVAVDPLYGRQLFRNHAISLRVSVTNTKPSIKINSYPNPATDYINFRADHPLVIKYTIFNSSGISLVHGDFEKEVLVNMASFTAGVYYFVLMDISGHVLGNSKFTKAGL